MLFAPRLANPSAAAGTKPDRMKKILFLTLAGCTLLAGSLRAQVRLGLQGGLNLADLRYEPKDQTSGMPDAHSLATYNAGLLLDIPLVPAVAIQTGVGLSSKGSKVTFSGTGGSYTKTINPLYLEIPAHLVFKPQIAPATRLVLGFGPYLGLGVGGRASYSGATPLGSYYSDHSLEFGNGSSDDLKATDIGGEVLAGLQFSRMVSLTAQYGMSFTNNAAGSDNNAPQILRNKVLSFDLGIYLGSH